MATQVVQGATPDDVKAVLAALTRLADQDALLVARFIPVWIKLEPGEAFPKAFLVELAAILRIGRWQQFELPTDLQQRFPPWRTLFDDLVRRFIDNPAGFCDGTNTPTVNWSEIVLLTWLHRFSWRAPFEIEADVVMEAPDEDMVLGAIAEFLISLSE